VRSKQTELKIFSRDTVVETNPYINIEVVKAQGSTSTGMISPFLRERLHSFKMVLDRRKRPKATAVFQFEDFKVLNPSQQSTIVVNDVSLGNNIVPHEKIPDLDVYDVGADILSEIMPLDASVKIHLGYVNSYKEFGPFDVVEHDVRYRRGGSEVTVQFEAFGRSKSSTNQEVFSNGSIYDVLAQLASREGLSLAFTKRELTELVKQAALNTDEYFSSPVTDDQQIFNALDQLTALELEKYLDVSPESPIIIPAGHIAIQQLHSIFANLGLTINVAPDGRIDAQSIFSTPTNPLIRLVYGEELIHPQTGDVTQPNVSDINFEVSKPKMSYLKKLVNRAVNNAVGAKGNRQKMNGRQVTGQIPVSGTTASNPVTNTKGNTGSTSSNASVPNTPQTKITADKQSYLKTTIARRRLKGEVLSAKVTLMTGTPIPLPLYAVEVLLDSTYYSGKYIIDNVTHNLSNTGYKTSLKLIRPPKKKKKGKPSSNAMQTMNGRQVTGQIPVASTTAPSPAPTTPTPTPPQTPTPAQSAPPPASKNEKLGSVRTQELSKEADSDYERYKRERQAAQKAEQGQN